MQIIKLYKMVDVTICIINNKQQNKLIIKDEKEDNIRKVGIIDRIGVKYKKEDKSRHELFNRKVIQ
jgi:hypothetical protein